MLVRVNGTISCWEKGGVVPYIAQGSLRKNLVNKIVGFARIVEGMHILHNSKVVVSMMSMDVIAMLGSKGYLCRRSRNGSSNIRERS
jgi:hypothetical protein